MWLNRCVGLLQIALILFVLSDQSLALPGRRLQATLTGPAPDVGSFQRAGCDNFTSDKWQPLRPAYHLTVPYGWMNDPHGMFELNGTTHVFMQYNPRAIQWGAPFWAHVVSKDLAHWTWLPPALLPDTMYDFNGVWSGAATVPEETGIPVLTYTAASTLVPEQGNFFQRQAMAVPEDMSDPLLKRWKKPDTNPFLVQVPPGGTNFQFRDPTEGRHAVWLALTSTQNPQPLPKSQFALAIGTQQNCLGGAGIFTAPTMAGPWSYAGNLYNQLDAEPEVNGQCRAGRTASDTGWPGPAYGGPCDQFGAYCRMWEVVDMAELEPGLFMLKWDDQSSFRGIFSQEWYVLGNGPWNFAAVNPPSSLFRGELDGQRFAPMRMDYGSVYASMVWRTSDMRQVMLSWIMDTAAGCSGSCSDQLPDVIARMGFKSAQTLPRVLTYEPLTKTLRAYPVNETALLRGQQVFNATAAPVAASPNTTLLIPEGAWHASFSSRSSKTSSSSSSSSSRQETSQWDSAS
ncbi:hypothetical protein OEZ85_013588 [Tetradesmus obliquus]|uniref:Glycosyl hydrolase family 32 N-terminal domain-containing protein n=1 Tax=Tetradesmus obliquus TaxID=3088 RepID=A0ABY8UQS9_TETOB|nr:hypothetical protein OEZ85_013588 [Tetradesmus obliquus]